ncbi:MAG: methylated-DNA--[protein]-cysteine S-methyltransferase [Verrucomicrobiae bacterium]|nr:methylated-DNA--[protein]-cysteine S-methyltransferase [Verrucomicrobiae bacterium]
MKHSTLNKKAKLAAWKKRDTRYDGLFVFGVKTTGIACRLSCPSQPKPENIEFFDNLGEALKAGYRPCKRCRPELASGQPPDWAQKLLAHAETAPDQKISAKNLRQLSIAPEQARRWFQKNYGMTFTAWCRGLRLSRAFTQMQNGKPLDDVIFNHGYESHSGFRDAFTRTFQKTPGQAKQVDCLWVALLETDLGPMLAAANETSLFYLEFADKRTLAQTYHQIQKRFSLPLLPGDNALLKQLRQELKEYFQGKRHHFTIPLYLKGTPFQKRVWSKLQNIPYGKTVSYETIARQLKVPKAVRAVARANATNPICLIVPCHRVIGKNGSLSGYACGIWRKRLLLKLENTGKILST